MFGYFGKGFIAPPPAVADLFAPTPNVPLMPVSPNTPADAAALTAEQGVAQEVPDLPEYQPDPSLPTSTAPSETDMMRSRLAKLRAEIEAKRTKQMAKVKAIRAKQAKQAAYGRDTRQARPKSAGYATESEKIMGGQTGYGGLSGFGQAEKAAINNAAAEVRQATSVVESLTKDVKMGMATKSELERAMNTLDQKIAAAQQVSKQYGLQGYGNTDSKLSPLLLVGGAIILYFIFFKK